MKIAYARQIPPEEQEPPIWGRMTTGFEDAGYENVIVFSTSGDYCTRTVEVEPYRVFHSSWNEVLQILHSDEDMKEVYGCSSISEVLEDYLYRPDCRYTGDEVFKWLDLLQALEERGECMDLVIRALELMTGTDWTHARITARGGRDYATIIYPPVQYGGADFVKKFQSEFFDTGSEWCVHEGDTEPGSPDEITGKRIYVPDFLDVSEEIKRITGADKIVLYAFKSWVKIPSYIKI